MRCTAHFELKFTGESVPLDAEIETDAAFNPKSYVVKGRNSTRSDLNLTVKITGKQAEIVEDGKPRTVNVDASQHVFHELRHLGAAGGFGLGFLFVSFGPLALTFGA